MKSVAPELLPVFVNLKGRRVLVVGGGAVAAAKVKALAPTGARLTVIAPEIDPDIVASGAMVRRRRVRDSDLRKPGSSLPPQARA